MLKKVVWLFVCSFHKKHIKLSDLVAFKQSFKNKYYRVPTSLWEFSTKFSELVPDLTSTHCWVYF